MLFTPFLILRGYPIDPTHFNISFMTQYAPANVMGQFEAVMNYHKAVSPSALIDSRAQGHLPRPGAKRISSKARAPYLYNCRIKA